MTLARIVFAGLGFAAVLAALGGWLFRFLNIEDPLGLPAVVRLVVGLLCFRLSDALSRRRDGKPGDTAGKDGPTSVLVYAHRLAHLLLALGVLVALGAVAGAEWGWGGLSEKEQFRAALAQPYRLRIAAALAILGLVVLGVARRSSARSASDFEEPFA